MNVQKERHLLKKIQDFQVYLSEYQIDDTGSELLYRYLDVWKSDPVKYNEMIDQIFDKTIDAYKRTSG